MVCAFDFETSLGWVHITEEGGAITSLVFGKQPFLGDIKEKDTLLLQTAAGQLKEYLAGARKAFDLPLMLKGTVFQKTVWEKLQDIPYGETKTYRELASAVGNDRASRAVGQANGRNPLPVFVPCHRVVGRNGALTGYLGGMTIKQYLLDLEKRFVKS